MSGFSHRTFRCCFIALLCLASSCRTGVRDWHPLAARTGCTTELLASTSTYDSTHVLDLAGTYRLIRVDTVPAAFRSREEQLHEAKVVMPLRLRVADSVTANWRKNLFPGMPARRVQRPIVGEVLGPDEGTPGAWTAEILRNDPGWLHLGSESGAFDEGILFDGVRIERMGRWGFGGSFREGGIIVPTDGAGNAIPYRQGIFCAFRE